VARRFVVFDSALGLRGARRERDRESERREWETERARSACAVRTCYWIKYPWIKYTWIKY
jgi:hypothetical protein